MAVGETRVDESSPGTVFPGTVFLWDITDRARPRPAARLTEPAMLGPRVLAFTADGRTLVVGGYGLASERRDGDTTGIVDLWNVGDGTRPAHLGTIRPGITGEVQSVGFSPDGQLLAAGGGDWNAQGGGTATLWDVAERTRPRRIGPVLTGHEGPVSTVAFAPNGRTLATGGGGNRNGDTSSGDVLLWDVTNRQHPSRIGQPLAGHHGPVAAAVFSPDGRTLATAGGGMGDRNGTMQLWDITDLPRVHPIGHAFTGHRGTVEAIAFTRGGRTLVSGGYDLRSGTFPTAALWDLAPLAELRDQASSRACDIAGGGLDEPEWSSYVPNLPYQKTCPG
ncbi:MAG TPA: hypothetical protein VF892_19150 [Pseudonocardiaceae bacterium]